MTLSELQEDQEINRPNGTNSQWYGKEKASEKVEKFESNEGRDSSPPIKVYRVRFYILLLYCLVMSYSVTIWNTWGPITSSALAAFPAWTEETVATLSNLGTITISFAILPTSWGIRRWGLRPVTLVITGCVMLSHLLRCVTTEEVPFTILVHICAFINGIGSTLLLAAPLIPALWFPASERVTATGFASVFPLMGGGVSFLETFVVRAPGNGTSTADLRKDINILMWTEFGIALVLFLAVLGYFPSFPPTPPSPSSHVQRLNFVDGFKAVMRNLQFWQVMTAYGVYCGVSQVWFSVISFSLFELGFNQLGIMQIAIVSSCITGLLSIVITRMVDTFYGHVKAVLLVMMTISCSCYCWFLLLALNAVTSNTAQVYCAVIGAQAFNFASEPLLFELCAEANYPSDESAVGTVGVLLVNLVGGIFLSLFIIPGISANSNVWVTCVLVGTTMFGIIPIAFMKEQYKRSSLDRKGLIQ